MSRSAPTSLETKEDLQATRETLDDLGLKRTVNSPSRDIILPLQIPEYEGIHATEHISSGNCSAT